LAVKKFGEKAGLQGLAKKTLANVDLHHQSTINIKTKPNYSFTCMARPQARPLFCTGRYCLQYKHLHQAKTPFA